MSVAQLPWANQSRRWLGRSPHGSSVRDVQTYTQRQTASRCLSETHDTLPRSAIWCLVPWSCWQPSETLADAVQRRWANWWKTVWWEQGWLMVIQDKKSPSTTQRKQKQKYFRFLLSANRQRVLLVGVFWGMFISSSWEKWQLKSHCSEIYRGAWLRAESSSVSKKRKKKWKLIWGHHSGMSLGSQSRRVCAFTYISPL